MARSKPDKMPRYQPRLNLDERAGEFFEPLMELPEKYRRAEMINLMQTGHWARKMLAQALPPAIAALLASNGLPSGLVPMGESTGTAKGKGSPVPRSAEESAGAAVACLDGWSVDDEALGPATGSA
jgi:hypothetical protein